jgi:glycosyltransferase involved in cell wall biosynthesis
MTQIAAVIMVKNEALRIKTTIESLNCLDGIILYDTGSDDDTINIAKSAATIPIHVKTGSFADFATSRNESLTFANECATQFGYNHFVLLDANDEFVGKRPVINGDSSGTNIAWYVEQRLKYGTSTETISFFNVKFIRAPTSLRYKGRVHEYLDGCGQVCTIDDFYLFQDKTADDDKSKNRWARDKIILQQEHENNPNDTRTLFYLAQTHACLNENSLAYEFYEKRTKSIGGFEEERYYSFFECGKLAEILFDDNTAIDWYTRAVRHSLRCEPLIATCKILRKTDNFRLAYIYAKLACELSDPKALLFVDREIYDYERWHILGIVAYYAAETAETSEMKIDMMTAGRDACKRAVAVGKNIDIDAKNLQFYQ